MFSKSLEFYLELLKYESNTVINGLIEEIAINEVHSQGEDRVAELAKSWQDQERVRLCIKVY